VLHINIKQLRKQLY